MCRSFVPTELVSLGRISADSVLDVDEQNSLM